MRILYYIFQPRPYQGDVVLSESKRAFENQIWMQRGMCYYCSKLMFIAKTSEDCKKPACATRDHYRAESKGGRRIVASCMRCNYLKGDIDVKFFKRIVRTLLQAPPLSSVWHMEIEGLQPILFRTVRVVLWKEKQKKKPNPYRQIRIEKEIDTILRLLEKLKP